jgi:TRAP-type C4-dicarboxylate transport system permease large subunit
MTLPSSRLQVLLGELKRRRVYRVAAVYLIAGFVTIQVADMVFPGLLLPSWAFTLVLVLLIVGLFMEMIAALVILVPILVPLVVAAGVDPIHFGIVIVMNLVIGALTPPLGVLVFTTARVGGANQAETFRAVIPFVLVLIGVLLLVTFVPALTMLPVSWFGP